MKFEKCWIYNEKLNKTKVIKVELLVDYLNDGWVKGRGKELSKKVSESLTGRKLSEEAKKKMSKMRKGKNNPNWGKKHNKNIRKKISDELKKLYSNPENTPKWKGGVWKRNIPLYDTYAHQIDYAEKVRKTDKGYLEVRCTYCGKWYMPKRSDVQGRIRVLNGKCRGENRLYCSKECKIACPIYNQKFWPKDFRIGTSREVQPELRQLVFERDNWTCQKCESKKSLHCHHKEGIRWNPLESADMDMCITYCKECHKEVHKKDGCGCYEMQCREAI